ncbi:MAG: 16S rRNA (guanine(966)-N(2))-methyltransferase RsmD [Bacteroidetes bacterium]|nr:16S rRNA (guanine(966)-N(2))-methyltransferase RsmD [Bacteroidota bacterium]
MRVIAGKYKGRKLKAASKLEIRPATDRVKETIFNVLQHKLNLEQIRVLDLFAGTGSLGIEAVSRGAEHVTFVDFSKESISLIKSNLENLKCTEVCKLIKADGLKFIERCDEKFDLIFADPPYAYELTKRIPQIIFEKGLLKESGFLIIEHSKNYHFDLSEYCIPAIKKEFGNTIVTFFTHTKTEK